MPPHGEQRYVPRRRQFRLVISLRYVSIKDMQPTIWKSIEVSCQCFLVTTLLLVTNSASVHEGRQAWLLGALPTDNSSVCQSSWEVFVAWIAIFSLVWMCPLHLTINLPIAFFKHSLPSPPAFSHPTYLAGCVWAQFGRDGGVPPTGHDGTAAAPPAGDGEATPGEGAASGGGGSCHSCR